MKLPASLRKVLLGLYYGGTLPYRLWNNARLYAAGRAPILVFFYHRIAHDRCVPWSHTNEEFARQIHWLRDNFELISLAEVQRRIRAGLNDRPAACITFDDGYAENCDHALPLLIEEQIPCTYFVCTHYILEQQPFPHDIARGFRLPPNTVEQIRHMAAGGIEIGAHTRTHADMGKIHDPRLIREEVCASGQELEQILGQRVRYFAFPYGLQKNMTSAAFQMAREHGYDGVTSAYGDYNYPGDDAFHIRRIHADDMLVLRNWATLDPRKLGNPVPCHYELPTNQPVSASPGERELTDSCQIAAT
ncbi:MAG: polysaccharide deacetylase family protein [Pirellulales bacterium]|nr:polysaccharide deacetylase family protein [Pirellulales bacterium]